MIELITNTQMKNLKNYLITNVVDRQVRGRIGQLIHKVENGKELTALEKDILADLIQSCSKEDEQNES